MPRTVLITGASGGIGAALARSFAARKYSLILSARSTGALDALAAELHSTHGVDATVITADLGVPGGAEKVAEALQGRTVDILVNNAGFATFGAFSQSEFKRTQEEITLNVGALTTLTQLFLPGMIARQHGRILNVASIAAFFPGPFMAVYYATKAYVVSLSLALNEECRGTGVTVSCLCPGPTHSNFVTAANLEASPLFKRSPLQTAEAVAEMGVRGCLRGQPVIFTSFWNWLQAFASRFAPRTFAARIVRRLQAPAL